MNFLGILAQAWGTFWNQLAAFAPRLLATLIILVAGYLLARLVRSLMGRLLALLRFEVLSDKSGIDQFLKDGGIDLNLRDVLALIVYWLILLLTFLVAANSLGLQVVAELFTRVALFIPNILVAILVLVSGTMLARFIGGMVLAFTRNMAIEGAETLAKLATWALLIFVAFVALEQLKIGMEILSSAFRLAFGAICLALALAFGLGGKDRAAELVGRWTTPRK